MICNDKQFFRWFGFCDSVGKWTGSTLTCVWPTFAVKNDVCLFLASSWTVKHDVSATVWTSTAGSVVVTACQTWFWEHLGGVHGPYHVLVRGASAFAFAFCFGLQVPTCGLMARPHWKSCRTAVAQPLPAVFFLGESLVASVGKEGHGPGNWTSTNAGGLQACRGSRTEHFKVAA